MEEITFFFPIVTLCSEMYRESEYQHHCILIMKEKCLITLEIELGVAVSKTFHVESNITSIHSVLSKMVEAYL
jgi:hypothetical protein